MKTAEIGQKVYTFNYSDWKVQKVSVYEIDDIYALNVDKVKELDLISPTLWVTKNENGIQSIAGYVEPTKSNKWGSKRIRDLSILHHAEHVNHMVWVDKCITNHGLAFGDEVFFTRDEAEQRAESLKEYYESEESDSTCESSS